MARVILTILALSLFSGCTTTRIKTVYEDKYIPVYTAPKPPVVERPELEFDKLSAEERMDPGAIAKAYIISTEQLKLYSSVLERIIDKYDEIAEKGLDKLRLNELQALENSGPTVTPVGPLSATSEPLETVERNVTIEEFFDLESEVLMQETVDLFDDIEEEAKQLKENEYKQDG